MIKHVVYAGSKEVWSIFTHTKLRSIPVEEMEDWLLECDLEEGADRYEFATKAEAMAFARGYNTRTHIQQAWACKIMLASYAVYEQESYDDDDEYDCSEIQYLKCSGFDKE